MIFSGRSYLTLLLFFLISAVYAWPVNPSNGWDFNYDASSGLRPEQAGAAVAQMSMRGYQTEKKDQPAFVTMISNQEAQIVLKLNNDGGEEASNSNHIGKFANYYLRLPVSNREKIYKTTLDAKFRLANDQENMSQFAFSISQPATAGPGTLMGYFAFSRNGITYLSDNKRETVEYEVGNTWHMVRIHLDLQKKTFSLFLDNKSTAVVSAKLSPQKDNSPQLLFGDGSQSVKGIVELSYIRFVNNETIPVK